MSYVKVFSAMACVAIGLVLSGEVPSLMADDRPDIGIVVSPIPEGKADVAVVYSASWCRPCLAMRPQWALLRSQGYKVAYIDVDNPHKYDGRWDYQDERLVTKAEKEIPRSVPTIRFYNSVTDEWVGEPIVGTTDADKVRKRLWKTSSSKDSVRESSR